MIKLFGVTDTDYTSNGDRVIIPLKARIHKEDNGSFYLELETDISYVDDLTDGRIIIANTPQGDQAFRISNVEKTKTKIQLKAWHVFYDSKNYVIQDSYVVDKNCNDALDHLNNATDNPSPFSTLSDVGVVDSYRCVRKSLYEAVNTVIQRWGGHLVRDNWSIKIMNSIGADNGVVVRYKKNLKDITCTSKWDNVCTKLMPVGRDGILLDETYLYSDIQYPIPHTKVVSFQPSISVEDYKDDKGKLDEDAYNKALITDLRAQGYAYLKQHSVPEVNYTMKANLEKVTDIGDTVEVIDEPLGIDIITHVISYDYDCILKQYKELEFGNFTQKLSNLVGSVTSNTQNQIEANNQTLTVTLSQQLSEAQTQIWNALGSSYCIYEGDKILIVDALPKEDAHNVIMINSGGIAFSQNGINGDFQSAWTIDNVLNMQKINVINLVADMIKGGTLKLGSNLNQNGQIEVYDEANNLIAELNKNGLKMYGSDGGYIVMNSDVGFAGYDFTGAKVYWVSGDEFHQKKSVIEEEITLCNRMRFIPITVKNGDTVTNDGIGLVSVGE